MTQVNFRIDSDVKREADELFDNLGLSLSAAITIFIKQAISHRGLPFAVCENDSHMMYVPAHPRPSAGGRSAALRALAGSWKDKRSTEEIIDDIECHRTQGRKVADLKSKIGDNDCGGRAPENPRMRPLKRKNMV